VKALGHTGRTSFEESDATAGTISTSRPLEEIDKIASTQCRYLILKRSIDTTLFHYVRFMTPSAAMNGAETHYTFFLRYVAMKIICTDPESARTPRVQSSQGLARPSGIHLTTTDWV